MSSTSTPWHGPRVDEGHGSLGPRRGAESMSSRPSSSSRMSVSARLPTSKHTWWKPSPLLARKRATPVVSSVGWTSSTLLSPTVRKAIRTRSCSMSMIVSSGAPSVSRQNPRAASMSATMSATWWTLPSDRMADGTVGRLGSSRLAIGPATTTSEPSPAAARSSATAADDRAEGRGVVGRQAIGMAARRRRSGRRRWPRVAQEVARGRPSCGRPRPAARARRGAPRGARPSCSGRPARRTGRRTRWPWRPGSSRRAARQPRPGRPHPRARAWRGGRRSGSDPCERIVVVGGPVALAVGAGDDAPGAAVVLARRRHRVLAVVAAVGRAGRSPSRFWKTAPSWSYGNGPSASIRARVVGGLGRQVLDADDGQPADRIRARRGVRSPRRSGAAGGAGGRAANEGEGDEQGRHGGASAAAYPAGHADPSDRPSGLAVPIRAPGRPVARLRRRWDRAARAGAQPHVTVLYPFLPTARLTPTSGRRWPHRRRRSSRSRCASAASGGSTTAWCGSSPSPPSRSGASPRRVVERWPDHPPYGGPLRRGHPAPDRGRGRRIPAHPPLADHRGRGRAPPAVRGPSRPPRAVAPGRDRALAAALAARPARRSVEPPADPGRQAPADLAQDRAERPTDPDDGVPGVGHAPVGRAARRATSRRWRSCSTVIARGGSSGWYG